jgi:hypothetical protein
MGDKNWCFGRHDKPLVSAAFLVVSVHSIPKEDVRQAGLIVKIIAESLEQHDEKQKLTPISKVRMRDSTAP